MTSQPIEEETLASAVARRVRGLMGERRLSGAAVARHLQMTQQAFSRRTTGAVSFSLEEIEQLADVLRTSQAYLLLGVESRNPRQSVTAGGDLYAITDSNREPADLSSATLSEAAVATIHELPTRSGQPIVRLSGLAPVLEMWRSA